MGVGRIFSKGGGTRDFLKIYIGERLIIVFLKFQFLKVQLMH